MLAEKSTDRRHHAGRWALAHLSVGEWKPHAKRSRSSSTRSPKEEPDAGYLTLRLIKANIYSDPVLDEPEFVALRMQLQGH